jgi:putative membrane protein
MSDEEKPDKTEMSEQRTDYAEDRTLLANERTFAGWFRTGIAAAALGLGFHALFVRMEPWWAPRGIATVFFVLAMLIFIVAERRASKVLDRLSAHDVKPFGGSDCDGCRSSRRRESSRWWWPCGRFRSSRNPDVASEGKPRGGR